MKRYVAIDGQLIHERRGLCKTSQSLNGQQGIISCIFSNPLFVQFKLAT